MKKMRMFHLSRAASALVLLALAGLACCAAGEEDAL